MLRIQTMHSIAWWPTLLTVGIAAFTDLRSRRIPNWLVASSFVAALVIAVVTQGANGIGKSLAGAALGAGILGALYLLGGMGMGDVKLCAAVGAWIGPSQLFMALIVMGLAGGVIALVWAACGGFLKQSLQGAGDLVCSLGRRGRRPHSGFTLDSPGAKSIPYAPAIAIGVVFSFLGR